MVHITRTAHRVSRMLGTLVLLGVTAVCLAWITPGFFGYERYVITGGSMDGSISRGSVVFEESVAVDDLAVGDVITYLPPSTSGVQDLVTHRIVTVKKDEAGQRVFRTQGDANPDPDPWRFSLESGTQPVVKHSVPHIGYAFVALSDPEVRMAVIGGPAALIALIALRDLVRSLRRVESQPDETVPAAA